MLVDLIHKEIQQQNEIILNPILNLLYSKLKDKIVKIDYTIDDVHSTAWARVDYWKNKTNLDKEIEDIVEYFDEYNNIMFLSQRYNPYLFGIVKDDSENIISDWIYGAMDLG